MLFRRISLFAALIFCVFTIPSFAQKGYQIKIKLDNYHLDTLLLGYHYGDKQYVKDTVAIGKDGSFVFEADTNLESGVYLVIMPPKNEFFQILVQENDQRFSIQTDAKDPYIHCKVKNSEDNDLFFKYMTFLGNQRMDAEKYKIEKDSAKDESKKKSIQDKLDAIDKEVKSYQEKIVEKYPATLTAKLIRSAIEINIPDFQGDKKEVDIKKFYYYRAHYFDNIDLADPRMLRSPLLFQKIDAYVNKFTAQHPDSICIAIDTVLERLRPSQESFRFYLIHFLNVYAKSNLVGMDAVYVHIAQKYYATGLAPWTDKEQLAKILNNASALEPILIGKIAPNIRTFKQDSTQISLSDVKSKYTVLFFWDPDCGHCKKSMPKMLEFYEAYKSKGVEVFAVCTKLQDEVKKCWETIEERKMGHWINSVDPFLTSRFKQLYDIRLTPQIFVLDENKKIISKRIGAEQLGEVMDQIIEMDKKKQESSAK